MGRLIDADKLKAKIEAHEIIKKFSITEYECGHNEGLCLGIDEVDLAETVEAIPLDWIKAYIDHLKAMGVQLSLRDAQAVSVMVDKWDMDNSKCGSDYCEIGEQHD